jgi:hypothetical protein
MSDCFDHEVEAYESLDRAIDEGFQWGAARKYQSGSAEFQRDRNFYHTRLKIKGIIRATDKAYLFKLSKGLGVWVPKSVCRRLRKRSVLIHAKTLEASARVKLT